MENELISVIVPVYNAARYIDRCIKSIREQSYALFELILVNDGSVDSSLSICQNYALVDQRITVLTQSNSGASAARNKGLSIAKGEYIIFADSDDFLSPDCIKNLYLAAKSEEFDIVQCNFKCISKNDVQKKEIKFSITDVAEITEVQALNERKYKVCVWGKIYKRCIFEAFRFQEGIIYEDDASYYVLVDRARKIGLLKETLYYYYLSDNSVMRNNNNKKSTAFIDIYASRIEYFKEKNNQQLVDGSHVRFCVVLLLAYAESLEKGNNQDDREKFLRLFKAHYSEVQQSRYVSIEDKLLFQTFYYAPKAVGKVIGKLRG